MEGTDWSAGGFLQGYSGPVLAATTLNKDDIELSVVAGRWKLCQLPARVINNIVLYFKNYNILDPISPRDIKKMANLTSRKL